ncbi:inositol monophosphatase family protein [Paenibacillus sp. YYML68]|uniref:inositol monophosphatase family protein n=1 Tax=Paenibacillus sp. YYML68 TaxID=2909250 RepID=UPI00248F9182|nr:inositol monophosphatase family protein [Paenibacillus sp. YYML68]
MSNIDATFAVGSKSFTAVAINTASKTGEWIQSKLGDYSTLHTKYSQHDLVTEVDKGAEMMIRKLIHTHFPTHSILGEEGVEPGPEASRAALEEISDAEYVWIVDPLDGTTNFVHGFPFFSVSIALAHRGEVIVGIVYNPVHDEMFVAEKGKGAYLKGKPMRVSGEKQLSEALIATGFPADRDHALAHNLKGIQALSPKARNIRASGSAALHMAYVAAGRLSGFWEIGLNAWDLAAGALLIQESGGQVTDTLGAPYQLGVRNVVASNGHIHSEFAAELRNAEATGF